MGWTYPGNGNDVIPNGFELGGIEIRFYAICIVTGMLLAIYMAVKEAKKLGIDPDEIYFGGIIGIIVGVIGARVYYVIFEWKSYQDDFFSIFNTRQGGLAIHGGIIAGTIFAILFCKKRKINVWKVLDLLAPGFLIGQIFGRWGNFFNQEAHGTQTTFEFLKNTLHLPNFIVNNMQFYDNGIFAYWQPTFLYESLWNLIALIAILIVRRKRLLKIGDFIPLYFIWYSIGRFFIEGTRTDALWIGSIRQNQLISIVLIIIGIFILIAKRVDLKLLFKEKKWAQNKEPYYLDLLIDMNELKEENND